MENRTCKQCGKSFTLTDSEINYFKSKGLQLPKRCKECRNQNKTAPQTAPKAPAYKNASSKSIQLPIFTCAGVLLAIAVFLYFAVFSKPNDIRDIPEATAYNQAYTTQSETIESVTEQTYPDDIAVTTSDTAELTTSVPTAETTSEPAATEEITTAEQIKSYTFRSSDALSDHFIKHGVDMGFTSADAYQAAASKVVTSPDALFKTEKEDGDYVYYLEATNEFVIVSLDGYIRTYFYPNDGKDYFDRQ